MRVLYILRLFTGFDQVLIEKKWIPTGVPTIFKALESFEKNFELNIILNKKKSFSRLKQKKIGELKLKEFKNNFIILYNLNFILLGNRINKIFTELYQIILHIYYVFKLKPDIVYIDNSNIISGAILCRLLKKKFVLE